MTYKPRVVSTAYLKSSGVYIELIVISEDYYMPFYPQSCPKFAVWNYVGR